MIMPVNKKPMASFVTAPVPADFQRYGKWNNIDMNFEALIVIAWGFECAAVGDFG